MVLEHIINFPIWQNDGKATLALNDLQRQQIQNFITKVETRKYKLEKNPCLCDSHDASRDVVVTQKDRYGIPCEIVLCRRCGLIRLKERLDAPSTAEFYKSEYRDIYVGRRIASAVFFQDQIKRGREFYGILEKHLDLSSIKTVFEVGCGAGGVLYPFHESGKACSGCDFGEKYLRYGQDKGLQLYVGEVDRSRTQPKSQDLLILSHVMEHFNEPLQSMNELIEIVSPGGYLIVQVPGIFWIPRIYINPILYFQNAHVHNYYYYYLKIFFSVLGLEIIYGDERCTFLLKKPTLWKKKDLKNAVVWDSEMGKWAERIEHELKKDYLIHKLKLNQYYYKRFLVWCLKFLGIKDMLKKVLGK